MASIMARGRRGIWVQRLARLRESGLTARAFAAQIGVRQGTLQKWKYKLAKEQRPARDTAAPAAKVEFVELAGVPEAPARAEESRLEVVCEGGRSVRVPRDFDAECLVRLLDVLERR